MFASQARLTLTVKLPATAATRLHREEPKPGGGFASSLGSEPSFSALSSMLVSDAAELGHGFVKVDEFVLADDALQIDAAESLRVSYNSILPGCLRFRGKGGRGGMGGGACVRACSTALSVP